MLTWHDKRVPLDASSACASNEQGDFALAARLAAPISVGSVASASLSALNLFGAYLNN